MEKNNEKIIYNRPFNLAFYIAAVCCWRWKFAHYLKDKWINKKKNEDLKEHEKITVRIYNDIGSYKDLTRHRFASFSVESTRFCSYNKDKFGNEITFINPQYIEDPQTYETWKETMQNIEKSYIKMKELGASTDMCREVLPHSTAAEYTMTANIREWRHILSLRTTKNVHPSIRQVLIPLLKYFQEEMPELFGKIEYDREFKTEYYANLSVEEEF